MNTCIARELDHIPRILQAQARYSLENNFKKITTNKNQVLLANINFQIILNRGAMKRMLILPPTSTLLIKKIIARDYIMRKYILK